MEHGFRRLSTPTPQRSETLLTPTHVAARCQISARIDLRAIQSGRLRASRLGTRGAYRITASAVDEWVAGVRSSHGGPPGRRRRGSDPRSASQPPLAGRLSALSTYAHVMAEPREGPRRNAEDEIRAARERVSDPFQDEQCGPNAAHEPIPGQLSLLEARDLQEALYRTRTDDPFLTMEVLYQLS
jgi:excisionase family DNA binding protein